MSTKVGYRERALKNLFDEIISNDNVEVVNTLINRMPILLNKKDDNGECALFIACEYNRLEVVRYLLSKGADIDQTDESGISPLCIASAEGYNKIVKLLIQNGAKVNKADDEGTTPLYVASERGHIKVVKILIAKGAIVNMTNNDGMTPLLIAKAYGKNKVVEYLEDYIARLELERAEEKNRIIEGYIAHPQARTAPAAGGRRSYTKRIHRNKK